MENYEINILKRNGDWKKYNQEDISSSPPKNIEQKPLNQKLKNDSINFISYINEVNLIVNKLENVENEKNNLKNELKKHEKFFQNQKKHYEQKLYEISKEIEMFEKTLGIIKNLKDF